MNKAHWPIICTDCQDRASHSKGLCHRCYLRRRRLIMRQPNTVPYMKELLQMAKDAYACASNTEARVRWKARLDSLLAVVEG